MNPHKGDVALSVGQKTYTLRYNHLALVKLERVLNKGLMKLIQEMSQPELMRIETVGAMLWAGLQKHHPAMTFDEAVDLLDEVDGGAQGAVEVLGDAFQRAFNAPGTKGTNPPQRGVNGTGTASSSDTPAADTTPTPSGTSLPAN